MKNRSLFFKIFMVFVLWLLLIIFVIPISKMMIMHAKMKKFDLPEYAEVILEPKVRGFSCSCGDRTNVEMVFRVPEDKANEIELRNDDEGAYRIIVDYFFEKDKVGLTREHDCAYVYDDYDPSKYEFAEKEDGYCYFHVIMRKYGSGITGMLIELYDK